MPASFCNRTGARESALIEIRLSNNRLSSMLGTGEEVCGYLIYIDAQVLARAGSGPCSPFCLPR